MERFLLYIAGFSALLILTSISLTLLHTFNLERKSYLEGEKSLILSQIAEKIYKCAEKAKKKRYSFVCEKFRISSNEEINSNDIINSLSPGKIDKSLVVAEDLGTEGEIIISYENNKIYVKKIW